MLDPKLKKRAIHRAKIIAGQMQGIVEAIEREQYCPRILEQSKAITSSLKSLEAFILENHMRSHLKHQLSDKKESEKAIKELIHVYRL